MLAVAGATGTCLATEVLTESDFQQTDASLNGAYAEAMKAVPADAQESLRESQRAWLQYRDTMAEFEAKAAADANAAGLSTMTKLTRKRWDWLRGIANRGYAKDAVPEVVGQSTAGPFVFDVIQKRLDSMDKSWDHFEYQLQFPGQDRTFTLGRLCVDMGYDARSLSLDATTDSLVQASWRTLSQGSGKFVNDSVLLLAKSEEGWGEAFRHTTVCAGYRGSITESESITVRFADRKEQGLFLIKSESVEAGRDDEQYGTIHYLRETSWPCGITGGKIGCLPGREIVRLEKGNVVPLDKLAHFLAGEERPATVIANLRSLNPSLQQSDSCEGGFY